jgi:guanyl-specific ribonuclease Sa
MTKPFGNRGIKGGMVLPYVDRDGDRIKYQEFDIRPYSGAARGTERVIEGDGRLFYTVDHYKTFVEIM